MIQKKLAYPIEEAAELISVTPRQLQDAVTARRIRHTCLGKERGLLFTEEQLMDYLHRNEREVQQ